MKKLIIISLLAILSCGKEELKYTGDVELIFHIKENMNYSDITQVNIYTAEIPDIPMFKNLEVEDGLLLISGLNEGNYFIEYNFGYKSSFQIVVGQKKKVDLYF